MKGSNTILMNPATVMAAIQFYLNECVFMSDAAIEVKSVSATDCSTTATLKVSVAEIASGEKK